VKTYPSAGNFLLANFGPSGPTLFRSSRSKGFSCASAPGIWARDSFASVSEHQKNENVTKAFERNGERQPDFWRQK